MAGPLRNIGFITKLTSILPTSLINSPSATNLLRGCPAAALAPSHACNWRQQPCATLRYRAPKKRWMDLPQPELKPIGPEDYNRWRHFLKERKEFDTKTDLENVTAQDIQISDGIQGSEWQNELINRFSSILKEIFRQVNRQIESKTHGRLFAVVRIAGKQFKITADDIIVVQGDLAASTGDALQLEKVLLVGSSDFTIAGRPLLGKDMVRIEATVIEKTLSHIVTHFKMKRRKQYRRIHFYRLPYAMLRINDIEIVGRVNEIKDVEGLEGRIL